MKKTIPVLVLALLTLGACSSPGGTPTGNAPAGTTQPTTATSTAPEPTPTPTPTTEAPKSDYAVTIDGSHQTKDYNGKPVLVVDFTFTNNSTKTASFMFATSAKAFQNGVELDTAIVTDDSKYDANTSMKDVKPGATLKVQSAYVLDDKSDVSVEVSELLSFDDTLIASATIPVS